MALFLLFITLYVVRIYYREDFAYYDDDQLVDFSLRGIPFPPPIWLRVGRFMPLAEQEFNLLRYFTRSPAGYHSFVVMELAVFVVVVFLALREFRVVYRLLILAAILLAPGFVITFGGFCYSERSVLLCLGVFLFCLCGYAETGARIYVVGCLVATQFALYYKETVVVFVVAYAGMRLLLGARDEWSKAQHSWKEFAKEQVIPLGMLGLAGIYTALFVALIFRQGISSYVAAHHVSPIAALWAYVQIDWLLVIFTAVISVRVGHLLLSKSKIDPMWDSLAVGAAVYFACIIFLGLYSPYYMAPADFIAFLYVARIALAWVQGNGRLSVSVVVTIFIFMLLHRVAYSSFRVIERKAVITDKKELAAFLKTYLATVKGDTVDLYFPYADGYRLMGLSSYLKYKGLPLAGQQSTKVPGEASVVIEGRKQFINNRCVAYRDYVCLHSDGAKPDALTIVLPDDDTSAQDMQVLGANSVSLLSVRLCSFCTGENRWVRLMHGISATHPRGELPGHWLELDVLKKINGTM